MTIHQAGIQQALGAYRSATATPSKDGAEGVPAPSFQALLKNELGEGVAALRHSEETSLKALVGQADVQALVEAISAAELSLQKVTAIRDRVLTAYQEIIRMPV